MGKLKEESPILGQNLNKPLRPEEFPLEEEIVSLTGEVGASKLESILRLGMVTSALAPIALTVACEKIPETPAIVKTPEEVGLPPTPTLEIKPTYSPTPIPKPSSTPTEKPTTTPTPEATPRLTPTKEPTTEPEEPIVYVAVQQITGYTTPVGEEIGYIIPGKKFTIIEEQDGWIKIRLETGAEGWIKVSQTAYYPEGQVPPTPTEVPPAYCEAPYWLDRTSCRKTGIVNMFGKLQQYIFPDSPYVVWYFKMPDRTNVPRRDARITAIDRQNQIITFQLNDGSTRQRRVTPNTQVIMWAHDWYVGIPVSQAKQSGGNFCDLEVGDAVSILHPSEPEAANPNPGLTDLWGVFIVQ